MSKINKIKVENEIYDVQDNTSGYVNKNVNNLTNYELKVSTANNILMTLNNTTYELTLSLRNSANEVLNTQSVDLPLETMVVDGHYDNVNKKIVLELESGSTIDVPVGDLINGLQSEITSSNKLDASLVDDSLSTNKFTNASEKAQWTGKYDKPNTGIPKTDLAQAVQDSLDLADSSLQAHQDITGKEDKSNKVTSLDSTSTDTQYPSAKSVWDLISGLSGGLEVNYFTNGYTNADPFVFGDKTGIYINANYKFDNTFYYKYSDDETTAKNMYDRNVLAIILLEPVSEVGYDENFNGLLITILKTDSSSEEMGRMTMQYNLIKGQNGLGSNSTDTGLWYVTEMSQKFKGTKTFVNIPRQMDTTPPTLDNQFTNKKYVDDSIASAITTTLNGSY